jgi:spermidine synthase
MPEPRVHTRHTRHGIELRIDGTLASLYKPGEASSGPVWNALAAPLLALPPNKRRRILLLGIGGGSVARLIRALAPRAEIVGVEKDAEVLRVARRELELDTIEMEIVIDDALVYLEHERRTFDAVVEDLMVGSGRHPRKPATLLDRYSLVTDRLARGGVLSVNTIHETAQVSSRLRERPGKLLSLAVREYHNQILVAGPQTLEASKLRQAMAAHPILSLTLPHLRLRTLSR